LNYKQIKTHILDTYISLKKISKFVKLLSNKSKNAFPFHILKKLWKKILILTPKGPSVFFDYIKILGKCVWLEVFKFLNQIWIESEDEEYLSYALNFMTFGNRSQKL